MADKLVNAAALAGMNMEVVNKLDQLLVGPNDRAYVVCSFSDCKLNIKGSCTIFAVLDVPRMRTGQPCEKYEKAPAPE
jgi:hypothetical protein